ncbi:MAG: hypothetical protein H7X95_06455, partial [Deltaproteobacteria bacterium]|nr:hypothetical protein [Deltaproteobacteria bacterium]
MSAGEGQTAEALDFDNLARTYARGERTPSDVVTALRARIDARGNDAIWISLTPPDALLQAARTVEARRRAGETLPLYGVP